VAEKDSCEFVNGMAECFWASAWADHCEEKGCTNLRGCEITEYMPEVPELAYRLAHRVLGRIEERTLDVANLFARAWKADGLDPEHVDYHGELANRFGWCLAYASMGAGVSWEDDHESFPELADADLFGCEDCGGVSIDLQCYAADHCEECEEVADGGMSDEQERAHERKQMGIT